MALGWRKDYLRYKELFLRLLLVYRKREDIKIFLELFLSLITIIFFSIFALKPTILTISQLVADNKEKQETINKMNQKINNISKAQSVYEKNLTKISIIENSIPDTPTPENLLRQIEGVAYINSVTIIGSSVSEVTLIGEEKKKQSKDEIKNLPENTSVLSFSVSVTGSFESLFSFLSNLENLRRPLIINSLNLTSSETDLGKIIVMIISGQTPYIKK